MPEVKGVVPADVNDILGPARGTNTPAPENKAPVPQAPAPTPAPEPSAPPQ